MIGKNETLNIRLKQTALILGWMLIGAGLLWAARWVWPAVHWTLAVLSPFLVALVVAYLFNPVVSMVQRRLKLGRTGGIVVVGVMIVALTLLFFGILTPILYQQTSSLVRAVSVRVPELATFFERWVDKETAATLRRTLEEQVRTLDLREAARRASPMLPQLARGGAGALSETAGGVARFVLAVTGFFATLVFVVVIAFYYLVDFQHIPRLIRTALPARMEDRTLDVLGKVDTAVGGFLRGQAIVCSLIALTAAVGLTMIGMVKYAVLVGVLAGAANVIPYLGPVVGATPALLWALLSSGHETWTEKFVYAGLVILLFVIIQMLDGFIFQPRVVGKSSNLHPLIVMLALLVGAQFGLGGMIIAVPTACVARVLFLELLWSPYLESQARMRKAIAAQSRE